MATAAYQKLYRRRTRGETIRLRRDALGDRRRLQALAAIGHTIPAVAAASGVGARTLEAIRSGEHAEVRPATHAAIRAAFHTLAATIPEGPSAERARAHAERRRWAPPFAWDNIDDPRERPKGMRRAVA